MIALLLVGFLALNYPLLALFSKAVIWMGIPALYLYLFVFWALFIGLMCAVTCGGALVGIDLSNDHPVGVVYPSADPRFKNRTMVERDLRLYDGKIECCSCHNAHNNAGGNFLRVESRQLCQTCHDY